MPQGHLGAIARVFFVYLVNGVVWSVGRSVSFSLSFSLSLSPSPFRMHCGQDEAKLMLNGPAPNMEWGGNSCLF